MEMIRGENEEAIGTDGASTLRSHLVCSAAEKSRQTKQIVHMDNFERDVSENCWQ